MCKKSGAIATSATGSYGKLAGWLTEEIVLNLEFFKII